ncbi:MAG: tetratricopeptide repeat protein [Gemmatimonadaceae bacterium]
MRSPDDTSDLFGDGSPRHGGGEYRASPNDGDAREASPASGTPGARDSAEPEVATPGSSPPGQPSSRPAVQADLYAVARAQSDAGKADDAIASYRQLVAREPSHVRARNNLALLLERGGNIDAAVAELDSALEVEPDNVSVLCNRAAILSGRLRYEDAERDLLRALRADEDNAEVLTNLGILFCRRGRWREAVEPLRRAAHAESDRAAAHYYLGEAYNHIDDLPLALQAYESAAALQPANWRAFKGVGIVLDRMGRPNEAAVAYARAREAQRR